MKPSYKLILAAALAASLATTLSGCAGPTLEQQIAVKEPGSWDFKVDKKSGGTEYIRIYDSPEKLGWFKYEYGQKHPCNQGFQKVTKTVAPGLVQYSNAEFKGFACDEKIRYIFRTDENGHPYEGWVNGVRDREKRDFTELSQSVKFIDSKDPTGKAKGNYILVK